ncbi:hypothetical protein Nham_3759 [Nitrobacter hamburgensis X14]|uniref:Uncharacterized protein n=1 Tax=Nitrobacter hamburgensis (strain DSM 10229 / NCIMB 13809 / X14) TaxID=323097 RepID=Q1QH14_NITHX|nr:hypothetical protein [Nitrobacter hamburgensis]ABE64483.1 hypothetical protein Nham_3759 [Nitrobacter hamburgensis X14]
MSEPKATPSPPQSLRTKKDYARRCRQLAAAAQRELAKATGQRADTIDLTPSMLVSFVIGKKGDYLANSWRVVRSAVISTLEQTAALVDEPVAKEIKTAIERLKQEKPAPEGEKKPVTSRTKDKSPAANDLVRIEHAALARQTQSAIELVRYFKASLPTGLRPCEWPRARFGESTRDGYRWMLVVENAKATNGRAHGPVRTLHWEELALDVVEDILTWITIAQDGDYDRRLNTIGHQLWEITRALWPRRKEWPTLYSARHVAIAGWKAFYVRKGQGPAERLEALAVVAALSGHGSDDTASKHYARANAASGKSPVPTADPAEVQNVRRVIKLDWLESLREAKAKKEARPPG